MFKLWGNHKALILLTFTDKQSDETFPVNIKGMINKCKYNTTI